MAKETTPVKINIKEPFNDPKFNELRDLLYDAENHMDKGRTQTCISLLHIVSERLGDLIYSLND